MLAPGTSAPEFTLLDQDGADVRLADQRGHWVVLYWYPKASTPGCTIQARRLRDRYAELQGADAVVLGASFDTPEENKAFCDAEEFPFRLLSDTERTAGRSYEVLREPGEDHADYAKRIAYLIDPSGIIRRSYDVTDVEGFAGLVLSDLEEIERS